MSVFVDTGVFFAQHDEAVSRHDAATETMRAVFAGEFGRPYTSDYVVDETVTLTRRRTGRFDAAWTVAQRILGRGEYPAGIEVLQVTNDLFEASLETYRRYEDHEFSFTDASTVALVDRYEIDAVVSFDDDFDGVVERIDPATV